MPHSIIIPDDNTALTYDLTTVEAVNDWLGIEGDTEANLATAAEITSYSKIIGEICDRVFAERSVVETFFLHEHYVHALALRHYPVREVTSVVVNNQALSANDYRFDPANGLLMRWGNNVGCHGWGCGEIAVTYTGGYELPDGAPESLARACIELIEDARISGERDSSIRDIQHGDRRVSYFAANVSGTNSALPASVADLIKPFKRVVLA